MDWILIIIECGFALYQSEHRGGLCERKITQIMPIRNKMLPFVPNGLFFGGVKTVGFILQPSRIANAPLPPIL